MAELTRIREQLQSGRAVINTELFRQVLSKHHSVNKNKSKKNEVKVGQVAADRMSSRRHSWDNSCGKELLADATIRIATCPDGIGYITSS